MEQAWTGEIEIGAEHTLNHLELILAGKCIKKKYARKSVRKSLLLWSVLKFRLGFLN